MEPQPHLVTHACDEWTPGLRDASTAAQELKDAIPADRLIELADQGFAPHYRIDGGPPLFHMPELRRWAAKNLLRRVNGQDLPIHLSVVTRPPKTSRIPSCIVGMAGRLVEFQLPPCVSGVYFLCEGDEVVYVGQSVNLGGRVGGHVGKKSFQYGLWMAVPTEQLDEIEGALIRHLRPKLNGWREDRGWGAPACRSPDRTIAELGIGELEPRPFSTKPSECA